MVESFKKEEDSNVIPFSEPVKSRDEIIAQANSTLKLAHLELRNANKTVIDQLIAKGELKEEMVFENGNDFDILYEGKKISSLDYIGILREKCAANIPSAPSTGRRWTERDS